MGQTEAGRSGGRPPPPYHWHTLSCGGMGDGEGVGLRSAGNPSFISNSVRRSKK